MKRIAALLCGLALLAVAAFAQAPGDEASDNGFVLNFLQNQISAPGREIRLQGVTGALSSQARVAEITISDDQGPWLRLQGLEIDWSRAALLLGRVNVERLAVERIDYLRRAVPPERSIADRLPEVEAQPFSLPELPVSVQIRALDLPEIVIDAAAFGQAATLSSNGRLGLADGVLDAALDLQRTDGPGGALELGAAFSNATRELDLDVDFQEPAGGLVATLLDIEGRPAIEVSLQGAGPLSNLDVDFAFDAGGDRIAGGQVVLRSAADGLGFSADFRGGLAPVVPAAYRDFFAGETAVEAAGVSLAAGGLRVDRLALRGAALDLTGALQTAPDGFPRNLTLSGRLGDPRGPAVILPVPGAATSIHSAILNLNYGQGRRWSGLLALDRLAAGDIEIEDLTLDMSGRAENLDDPARRNVTVALEGVATGVWSADADVAAALGTRLDFFADVALPPGAPVEIRQAQISGDAGLSVFAAGTLRGLDYDGRFAARIADIAPASGLAGRDLGGSLDISAAGAVSPLSGAFDLTLDGTAQDLRLGDPRLDGLLAGATTLSGGVARGPEGFRTDAFRLANPQLELTSSGRLSSTLTDLAVDARLADLARLDPRLGGAVTATGRASGEGSPVRLTFDLAAPELRAADRTLTGLALGFDGTLAGADLRGEIRGGADLEGQPIVLNADLDLTGETRSLTDLLAQVGPNRLTGQVSQTAGAAILGELDLAAPDVAPLAALALTEASGSVDATLRLTAAETGQGVDVTAALRDLATPAARIGSLDLTAAVTDALGTPLVDGDATVQNLSVAGIDVASLTARAALTDANAMQVSAQARLAIGTEAALSGALTRLPNGFAARLDSLTLRQETTAARLTAPATISVSGGTVRLTPLALDLGAGRLTAQGEIAEAFDIDLALDGLPLALANTVQPALGLEGAVTGSARITGPRAAPDVTFDLVGDALAAAATRAAGLPPARLTATGRTANQRLTFDGRLAATGLEARVAGSAPLGAGPLAVDVTLTALPLSLLDRIAGNRGLAGDLTGQARVAGTVAAPEVTFDLRGANLSATLLQQNGVAPATVTAQGGFARDVLTLGAAEATNGQGLSLRASGRAPLSGPGLDLTASGTAPLSLADALLAERSAQVSGQLTASVTARGALAAPQLAGTASLQNGAVYDPTTNIRLRDITADAALDGQTVTLRAFRAAVTAGGEITAAGTVSIDGAQGNPADLTTRFNQVRYTDGALVTTQIDGELRVSGPLRGGGGLIAGAIDLGRTEISVEEGLGGNAQAALDQVAHRLPPPGVVETLERARVGEPRTREATAQGAFLTDVTIRAPNQIFVRGRGLDVELGGGLRITGPTNAIVPVGQFELRRGRLQILGQRIDFEQGSLQLTGNLDPQINFVARTQSVDVTAIVTVTGRVSSPEIVFSSQPPLPPDEVLARVLFNRSVSTLSPFQIAQLASAAAELAGGGGGPGILEALRQATGFDDLDIVTEEDGQTALRAGRYIDDNIYLDVQAEQDGDTRARINLDVTDNFTVRGSVGTDGDSTLGIFFERDY